MWKQQGICFPLLVAFFFSSSGKEKREARENDFAQSLLRHFQMIFQHRSFMNNILILIKGVAFSDVRRGKKGRKILQTRKKVAFGLFKSSFCASW